MRALVVFESMFGNTEAVAARARQWGEDVAAAAMGSGRVVHR